MSLDTVFGQEHAISSLRSMVSRGRIPSALLFVGPHHVGKRTTALRLAASLNCAAGDGEACGRCPSCRKIEEGLHPDVETVAPDGQFIRIQQVRDVIGRLGLVPCEARKRVVVMARAEKMHTATANAFLKTLEEPPTNTLIVLCAESRARLPETIVSRCLPVRFGLLPAETVRSLFSAEMTNEAELDFAVRFARGRLRPVLRERAAGWMAIRDTLIEGMSRLGADAFGPLSDNFAKWAGSEDWRFVLEWLETWFRDLALLGTGGAPETLINGDRLEALAAWRERFDAAAAVACHRRVLAAGDAIQINAAKPLALEALWLACREQALQGRGGTV